MEPLFLHRFSETPSDRLGFRRYVGTTKHVVISGVLLGIVTEGVPAPVRSYGAVAIGHNLFYFEKGFTTTGKSSGCSVLYVPADIMFPEELLNLDRGIRCRP